MTHITLTLAAIFAIALLLREAWERGRRSGLEECPDGLELLPTMDAHPVEFAGVTWEYPEGVTFA